MMIIDVLAGAALVIGSLLAALGAFGLLRFPDVFTRMHAATKAATVGVIGTTAAAAVEAGAVGGVMVLLLVVALLFLSGPLGMSLLARAAYHDPETPMWKNTRELPIELPIPESTPSRRRGGASPYLGLWLFAIWVAAFGSVAPNVLAGGVLVAGALAFALRHLAPRWPRAVLQPLAAFRFAGHFMAQLAVSTWDVIKALRLSPEEIRPAIIEIPLRVRTRNEVTLLMNSISFTPGTVALELHGRNLYVHVLTTDDPAAVVREVAAMEDAVMAAFSGPAAAGATTAQT
jgi:multicomponent Na+:H+ antiporter subunit G